MAEPLPDEALNDLDDGAGVSGPYAHRLIAELRALRAAARPFADCADRTPAGVADDSKLGVRCSLRNDVHLMLTVDSLAVSDLRRLRALLPA